MDESTEQRRRGERRRLWDRRAPDARRAGEERRTGDRRSRSLDAAAERRAGADRRRKDRRRAERRAAAARRRGRRRRETPTPYSIEEAAELKARFAAAGPVACPSCGSRFTLGPGRRRGAEVARRVMCLGCGRAAVVPHSRAARVLVVDANAERREGVAALVGGAGHEVIEAADAAVALAAYGMVPADVIVLNVLATGRMAAPEFLRRLRRNFPEARVLAMAGRASYREVDPLAVTQGLGAVRTIRMPASRDDILKALDDVRL